MFTWTWLTFAWIFVAFFAAGGGWTLACWLMGRLIAAIFKGKS